MWGVGCSVEGVRPSNRFWVLRAELHRMSSVSEQVLHVWSPAHATTGYGPVYEITGYEPVHETTGYEPAFATTG